MRLTPLLLKDHPPATPPRHQHMAAHSCKPHSPDPVHLAYHSPNPVQQWLVTTFHGRGGQFPRRRHAFRGHMHAAACALRVAFRG